MKPKTLKSSPSRFLAIILCLALTFGIAVGPVPLAMAQQGGTIDTPPVIPELPVEVETELAPAGSLKQSPLWKELEELLEHPYDPPERRPSFLPPGCSYQPGALVACDDSLMPPLNVYPVGYNPLTGQPLRLRITDGEISWDIPGPIYGDDDDGDPTTPRPEIGALIVEIEDPECPDPGCLVVSNPTGHPDLPADDTIVAVPAYLNGQLHEYDPATGELEPVTELEAPVNENDFVADRGKAEVLGKALFWDMQIGSDGVQACGTCHFHGGVDNRTKNQLNPGTLGGDSTLQVRPPNEDVTHNDFPFHKLFDPSIPGEPNMNPSNVQSDKNDVMSSMGVVFQDFVDIPAPGPSTAFGPTFSACVGPECNVAPLLPDIGNDTGVDPVAAHEGFRRVEPRNTPTMHSAAFNFDNFWDGRARFNFNGGSVFGPSDPQFHVYIDGASGLEGADMEHFRPELATENPDAAEQPVRIKFSSLASQAVGPPLSDFEMSFAGRNWPKIGKKMLQAGVVPLANQLVDVTDSLLGPYSNQGGSSCPAGTTAPGKPGLCISYEDLIELAFNQELWSNTGQHLDGCYTDGRTPSCPAQTTPDPFDQYVLTMAAGQAAASNTNQFTQMEANFSLFFGLAVQLYEQNLILDNTPFDQFMDANPLAANGVGQPGEQGTLPPDRIKELVTGSPNGTLNMVPGFGEDELFGFDIFAGSNLTAALPLGGRNPDGNGSNPFLRTGRCMICHLGPEQTDHTINVNHGLVISDTEIELPPSGEPEPTGPFATVSGFMLAEEVEEPAQDGVEVENRNFSLEDDPATPYDDRQIAVPSAIAFQDNGIYNIGLRPTNEDIARGGDDPFGWPLALAALALKNLAGPGFEACDNSAEYNGNLCTQAMPNFDPSLGVGGGLFEETGADQSINPGLEMPPITPMMPAHMAPFLNNLPAGEAHPQIDELAFAPNTITEPPFAEFGEIQFGSDVHCAFYDPAQFPELGWGPACPNVQSAVTNNFDPSLNGTWPFPNRVARDGAIKAPQLRNVEFSGPYFHTGSYLTLRQVVDFYMRGGDFPKTNAEDRDPNLVDIGIQAFGFGSTIGLPPEFQDGGPDTISLYGPMPDTAATTPEYATPEDAKRALVKFLLALTDSRAKFEQAPFDRPEIFVPIDGADGTGRQNNGGRAGLMAEAANATFRHIPAVGAAGNATPLANFLNVSSVEGDPGPDHFEGNIMTNFAPTAFNDQFKATTQLALKIPASGLLANDTDRDRDPLKAVLISPPSSNATLNLNPDGSFTYVYNKTLSGCGDKDDDDPQDCECVYKDKFKYKANDGRANSSTAVVKIKVSPPNQPPVAKNDNASVKKNKTVLINVLANDYDPVGQMNRSSVTIITSPTKGTATVMPFGKVKYVPNTNFVGTDTFTYTVNDKEGLTSNVATVTVKVKP